MIQKSWIDGLAYFPTFLHSWYHTRYNFIHSFFFPSCPLSLCHHCFLSRENLLPHAVNRNCFTRNLKSWLIWIIFWFRVINAHVFFKGISETKHNTFSRCSLSSFVSKKELACWLPRKYQCKQLFHQQQWAPCFYARVPFSIHTDFTFPRWIWLRFGRHFKWKIWVYHSTEISWIKVV